MQGRIAVTFISLSLLLAPPLAYAKDPVEIQNYLETYYERCENAGNLLLDFYRASRPRVQRAAQAAVDCRCEKLTEAVRRRLWEGEAPPSDAEQKSLLTPDEEEHCRPPVP